MNRQSWTVGLAPGATVLALFVALQRFVPWNGEPFSELGILGPSQKIGGYPVYLTVGRQFLFYWVPREPGGVNNYEVLIKLGIQSTLVRNSQSANASTLSTFSPVLDDSESSTLPWGLSVDQAGTNLRLILELWRLNATSSQFGCTGPADPISINVTSK